MKKYNVAEKYLYHNKKTVLEIIFYVLIAIGAPLFLFVRRYGFIGLPMLLAGSVGTVFLQSTKISDSEFDSFVERILKNNGFSPDAPDTLLCYTTDNCVPVIGKDGVMRSGYLSAVSFEINRDKCAVTKCDVDVCGEKAEIEKKTFPGSPEVELAESPDNKRIAYLTLNGDKDFVIPVDMKNYDTDALIQKLKDRR